MWRYGIDGYAIEKRVLMPHGQNTVHVTYTLVAGEGPVRLTLRPSVQFRGYESAGQRVTRPDVQPDGDRPPVRALRRC